MASETLWIGGHTKSGTTWLKFLVAALLYRTNRPKTVEKKIPTLADPRNGRCGGKYKIHTPTPPANGKLLYIVRHPVDICVSGINHVSLSTGSTDKDKYVERFIETGGNTIGDFGAWDIGVRNWISEPKVLWLRYEDLLLRTYQYVQDIARFVGADIANVDYAVESTSFKTMRRLEKKGVAKTKHNVPDVFYNPKHKGYKKGLMFINRGKSGYAREILSEEQIRAICDRFSDTIRLVGYEGFY